MVQRGWSWCLMLWLAAGGLMSLTGCFGVSQNPSYFPHLLPTGDIIRTHAKPGFGYYSDFDKHACRLEVRPLESTNPVQTQHVIVATIYDECGKPRRHRRIEWMLEGVGNIVEVDESGFFPGRGYKVDNKYAVSYTDYCEHRVTMGNQNPNDDFVIRPGQSWCVITSAVEGDTHVTVYAPGIYNWDKHKVFVTKHWVDAEWVMPAPAVNRAGTQHVFTTNIFRHTDRQPLANYRVRYRIIDGPPAVFVPSQTQEAVAISDLSGNASVTLAQVSPQPGINRISVEIIRPPDPCSPSGVGMVIGRGETTKEWLTPMLSIAKTGPATVMVNQEVPYNIVVSNVGRVDVQAMTVRDQIPEGLEYVRSEPPASVEANQLTWTMSGLNPGQAHTLQVVFRAQRAGQVTNTAVVTTSEGQRAENSVITQIVAPGLKVVKNGPPDGIVGVPIAYQITVTNNGTGPATNVVLNDNFDSGLEHESHSNPLVLNLGNLGAGETRQVPLNLTPREPGRFVNRVKATADGGLTDQAEHWVVVRKAQLKIEKTGPVARYVDRPAEWKITVTNEGDVPVANVTIRDQLPPELSYTSASDGGQFADGYVTWNIGTLAAHQQRTVQLVTRCVKISPRALNVAVATADPGIRVQAEAGIEIRGLPALRLEVIDIGDPAEVGSSVTYKIEVHNQGSLPGRQVQIVATVPPEMQIVKTNGPTNAVVTGQEVNFPPVDSLPEKQTLNYEIEVKTLKPGDVRFTVKMYSATLGKEPVIEQESTTIYAPVQGAPKRDTGTSGPPAAAPAPAPTPPAPSGTPTTPAPSNAPAPAAPSGTPAPPKQ